MAKKCMICIATLLFAALSGFGQKKVAIMPVVDEASAFSGGQKMMVRGILTDVITDLDGYEAYDRVSLSSITEEQKFQRSGSVSDDEIKRIGIMTGCQYILVVTMKIFDEENTTFNGQIINVETAKIDASGTTTEVSNKDGYKKACGNLVRRLLKVDLGSGGSIVENKSNSTNQYSNYQPYNGGRNCDGFYKVRCNPLSKEYSVNSDSRSIMMHAGQTKSFPATLYKNKDYRISVCSEEAILGREMNLCLLDNSTNEILYDNRNNKYAKVYEFSVEESLVVSIRVTTPKGDDGKQGCVGILIEEKDSYSSSSSSSWQPTPPSNSYSNNSTSYNNNSSYSNNNNRGICRGCGSRGEDLDVSPENLKGTFTQAVRYCSSLGNGWYLPSTSELNAMYNQKYSIGGFSVDYYWSGTTQDSANAWGQYFGDGERDYFSKGYTSYYRCVRKR